VAEVRKARDEEWWGGERERMLLSWAIMAAFRVCVVWRAWFSFFVSWRVRRRWRIDSGVGEEGGRGRGRFWVLVVLACMPGIEDRVVGWSDAGETYLVMPQPHPRRQIIWNRQDIPQRPDLEIIKRLVDRRLKQCLQLMHAILYLGRSFGVFDIAIPIRIRN